MIDHFAVTKKSNSNVNYFKVLNFTAYSDHKPIAMELRCNTLKLTPHKPLHEVYQPVPTRFIFSEENKNKFVESMSNQLLTDKKGELTLDCISQSLKTINDKLTKHIRENATKSFRESKQNSQKNYTYKKPLFNWQARQEKRLLLYYVQQPRQYHLIPLVNIYEITFIKRLLSKCETKYFEHLNKDIEGGKVLNWQSFKKLKSQKSIKDNFDSCSLDINNFESFFRDLYADKHKTMGTDKKDYLMHTADIINLTATHNDDLN